MQQSFTTFLALFLASGALAVPAGSLNTRQTSPDGSCGGTTGFVCATGFCCSQFGFCGQGASFCGSGSSSGSGSTGSGSTGTCSWAGHCAGATCSTDNDCSDPFSCVNGICGGSSSSGSGGSGTGTGSGSSGSGGGSGAITCTSKQFFTGDGSTAAGWPAESAWASFDNIWNANVNNINNACQNNGWGVPNNSAQETSDLHAAILSIASASGVDSRYILATVIQESKGCVRVPTTQGFFSNPGLMQDADGSHTCWISENNGVVPCPNDEIVGMIQDGTQGTVAGGGDGLQQLLASLSTTGAQQVYQAARLYNSGSIPSDGNLSEGGATSSYSSDIANRLTGCVF
ncbi:polysaccharide deacetylase family protein [Trichoderma harzianum]|uniref:Polysaccharide deacetylase family protein n=1 Tax=Trichoderma harzianum TaxID=5544 RepID=A0A0F9XG70_TRIHA|nr:polysaccharide deacetylase family protein [Trichoderma harzianum]